MEPDIHLKIERYLGGLMLEEQHKAFEQELLLDNELRKEVDLYKTINHHFNKESWELIEGSNKSKNELDDYFKSDEAKELKLKLKSVQEKYNKSHQFLSLLKYLVAAASILLIVSVSYSLLKQKSYQDLYVEFYNEKELPSFVTRGNDNETLNAGVFAFKANNHKAALKLFDDYIVNSSYVNPLMYIYKGMCHMELNEFNKAIQAFDQLINSDSIDSSKGLWYKCLVYLKTNDLPNLKSILQKIRKNPDNYNYTKSKELLESL